MSDFVHLHVHTEYSLLDGLTTPEELADIAYANGQQACAITDHGSMAGTLRFQSAARRNGINPIFGCEFYYVPSLNEDENDRGKAERFHLILLAKNDEGLKKLFKLQKLSWTNGFYYKPRIEHADLEFLSGDVVCLSGCMGGYLSRLIFEDKIDEAVATASNFHKVFGNDYYVEVQPWNPPELNRNLIEIAGTINVPIIGTIDAHYPTCNERGIEEVLLAIGQAPSMNAAAKRHMLEHSHVAAKEHDLVDKMNILYPDRKLTFQEHDTYVMNSDEVKKAFANVGINNSQIIDSTLEVADKCHAEIKTGRSLLPKYSKVLQSDKYLRDIVYDGLEEKGLSGKHEYIDRLEEELRVINKLNFEDYFLCIWDIVAYARRTGIAVGHSRGSVGGSLIAYLMGITSIDPIKFGLLFARFINEERNDYPDIDLDFEDARRHEIKQYIRDKWGEDNVASISTYGAYKPKSTIKDIARVFGVPFNTMNDLTQKFETIEELERGSFAQDFLRQQPDIVPTARRLVDRIRNAGAHAAGVVISNVPLEDVLPLESRPDSDSDGRMKVAAYDMNQCAEVGLIKIDVLGVRALTVVNDAISKIKELHNIDVTEKSLELDDPDVYRQFSEGFLTGIFQVEASAYRNLISDMGGIDNFGDLVASNALVRPGALVTQGASYIERKFGREKIDYHHELLEDILKETYGKFLYQEQLMQAVVLLAGFTWAEADQLRKIIGKKRDMNEFAQYRNKFVDGASKHISEKAASNMWHDFEMSSTYMFNKSHAVGYSMLSYQTMWLKYYYPAEFIWASLYNETNKADISGFIVEAKRLGIKILPPDVSFSDAKFTLLPDGTIRFGLLNVANCGPSGAESIVNNRPYNSFNDFVAKNPSRAVNSRLIENLDKIGAFDSLGHASPYDHKNYYLPILSFPIDDDDDSIFSELLTPCGEANDEDWNIVRGLIKSTSKKPTFFRVEIEDSSGIKSVFADRQSKISARDYVVAMVRGKSMVAFTDATVVNDNFIDPFVMFLREHLLNSKWYDIHVSTAKGDPAVIGVILDVQKIKSKSGYRMVNIHYWDGGEILVAKIPPEEFAKHSERLKQFNTVVLKLRTTRSSATIENVRLLSEYCEKRGIETPIYVSSVSD